MKRRTFCKNSLATSAGIILIPTFASLKSCRNISPANEISKNFFSPPSSYFPQVWWCWLGGDVTEKSITDDLEALKRIGTSGIQFFEFGPHRIENPVLFGTPKYYKLFQHTVKETDRLGFEFSMHNCGGFSASGGPWMTPELSPQVLTWSETLVKGGNIIETDLPEPASQLDYYADSFTLAFPTPHGGTKEITDWRLKADFPDNERSCKGCKPPEPPKPFKVGNGVIDPESVIDISSNMDKEGHLVWNAPEGEWTILRMGHTTNLSHNNGTPDNRGLECDKFNPDALEFHFNNFFNEELLAILQPLINKEKAGVEIDSYEAGLQNWTAKFPEEFNNYCRYDLRNYMPAMTGRVVGNEEISDRFLWDVRKAQADLMNRNYYGHFTELCHNKGLKTYTEAYYYTEAPFDMPAAESYADIPMCEFWSSNANMRFNKVVTSTAHLNGKPVIAAEAFTSDNHMRGYPGSLKAAGDVNYATGVNLFFLNHMLTNYPLLNDDKIKTLEVRLGGIMNLNNTWFEQSKDWVKYMGRCQYLLQQGNYIADILYFGGENSPVKIDASALNPNPPAEYDFDITGAETIITDLKIENGLIVTSHGMSYRVMFLPDPAKKSREMLLKSGDTQEVHASKWIESHTKPDTITLELLRKIHELVNAGMVLIVDCPKPLSTPGLADYPENLDEFNSLSKDIWGDMDGVEVTKHSFGKGEVYYGEPIDKVLKGLDINPDFEFTSKSGEALINNIHRRIGETDIYFVANRGNKPEELTCTFRVKGKQPELWDAVTGEITKCKVFQSEDSQTIVPIQLDAFGSLFIVFSSPAQEKHILRVMKDGSPLISTDHYKNSQFRGEMVYFNQKRDDVPVITNPFDLDLKGSRGKMMIWSNGQYNLIDSNGGTYEINVDNLNPQAELTDPWKVTFPEGSGTPPSITLENLISLSEHPDDGVRYFSGTAIYKTVFDVSGSQLENDKELFIDLGLVQMLAEVFVNGKNLGVLWTSPFRINITKTVQIGSNDLEIRVTNTWLNRNTGNEYQIKMEENREKGIEEAKELDTWADSTLTKAGLIGPVVLRSAVFI